MAGLALISVQVGIAEPARTGIQGSSSLNSAKLEPTRLQPSRVEASKLEPAQKSPLQRPSLQKVSSDLVRDGLTGAKLQGAASSIPPSTLGELFFDVAGELERSEGGVTEASLGYYMAALSDPVGRRYKEAKRKVGEILRQSDLSHEQAVSLYDGGLAVFMGLYRLKMGLTRDGVESSLRDLKEIKLAYQERGEVGTGTESSPPDEK